MPLRPIIEKLRVYMPRPEAQDLVFAVSKRFGGDPQKTIDWFESENPRLLGKSPLEMIEHGQEERIRQLITAELESR